MKSLQVHAKGLVYDVGMNNGDDSAYYLEQGHEVLAVEPDPDLVGSAEERFQSAIQSGRVTILNVGISDHCGTATFWICDENRIWNSFFHERIEQKDRRYHSIQIPIRTLPDMFDQYGMPVYLKIDVEGYEQTLLRSLGGRPLPKYISAEDDWNLEDCGTPSILARLHEIGYKKFKLISQHDHQAHGSRSRTVERILTFRKRREPFAKSGFPEGSSGPWGEETDGRWLSFADAAKAYSRSKELHALYRREFWVDWHASR